MRKLLRLIVLLWRLSRMVRSPQYTAAAYAVHKTQLDPSLKPVQAEAKRAEGLEWMGHYAAHHNIPLGRWESRLLLELAVGLEQGHIPC